LSNFPPKIRHFCAACRCLTCPQHLHAAIESLIGRFIIDDRENCVDSARQSTVGFEPSSPTRSPRDHGHALQCDDLVHQTIERLLLHVPALSVGSGVLVKQLGRQFPHTAGSTTKVRRSVTALL